VENPSGILDSMGTSLRELARRITSYGYGYVNGQNLHAYSEACAQTKSQGYRKVKVGKEITYLHGRFFFRDIIDSWKSEGASDLRSIGSARFLCQEDTPPRNGPKRKKGAFPSIIAWEPPQQK